MNKWLLFVAIAIGLFFLLKWFDEKDLGSNTSGATIGGGAGGGGGGSSGAG